MSRESRCRHVPRPQPQRQTQPFESSETAWFWLQRARVARAEGARLSADPQAAARPCDPDDIVRVTRRLAVDGSLGRDHLRVLDRHGRRLTRPAAGGGEQAAEGRLGEGALAGLGPPLRAKGIVA